MKKILSVLLILALICTALVSCSSDDAPDGMMSATVMGEPFMLYVPEGFTLNTTSGISSAYLSTVDCTIIVTARYYTPTEEMTLDAYMNMCADSYIRRLDDFRKTSEVAGDVLGGRDARRLEYIFTDGNVTYTVVQRSVEWKGNFVSLNIYTTGSAYELFGEYIDNIVNSFTLVEGSVNEDVLVVDEDTPEGMRIASSDVVEYRFFVPTNWVCNPNSEVSEAYHPKTRANVTVTSYSPSGDIDGKTLSEYVSYCISKYEDSLNGFELVERGEYKSTVAEKKAESITYLAEYDGVSYKIRQVVFYASEFNLYYTFTYTAVESDFDKHVTDLEKMIDTLYFR